MTLYRETIDCPLCYRGTVEVEYAALSPDDPQERWWLWRIIASTGCDHADLLDYQLMDGDVALHDEIAIALAL